MNGVVCYSHFWSVGQCGRKHCGMGADCFHHTRLAQRVDSLLNFKGIFSFEGEGNFSFEHQAAASVVEISGVGRAKTLLPSKAV